MLVREVFSLVAMFVLVSCGQKQVSQEQEFSFPVVHQTGASNSAEYFKANQIEWSQTRVLGKSKFCATLEIGNIFTNTEPIFDESDRLEVASPSDTLKTDGFELHPDYNSNIYLEERNYIYLEERFLEKYALKYFYPVYLVNQTPSTRYLLGKDSYVFAIQEALDREGIWRPIERRALDFCGNGRWIEPIKENEFFVFLVPKYHGDFETKMRVRLKIGNSLYVSQPFDGRINMAQIEMPNTFFSEYAESYEIDKATAIEMLFYGAVPLEVEIKRN